MRPSVELVTLSDSLTSPIRKRKRKARDAAQGATNVVCLDSDTESDGSYVHTTLSRGAVRASNGVQIASSGECKEASANWLGLHTCSNHSKYWSASQSLSSENEMGKDARKACKANSQSEQIMKSNMAAKTKRSTLGFDCTSQSVSDLSDKPDVYHANLQPCEGFEDITLGSTYSPVDQGFGSGCSYLLNQTMNSGMTGSTLLLPMRAQGVESSPSKDSSDYSLPAWDDQVKGILSNLETSKAAVQADIYSKHRHDQEQKQEYYERDSNDDNYHGDYSILRNKLCRCGSGVTNGREATQQASKATAKPIIVSASIALEIDDSVNALDKEIEKLKTKEKLTKDRDEREARKLQLKVEREMLRKKKQEEKKRQQEQKKRRNEEEKKRKEELKVEAAERRKVEKEKEKWEKGKFALQNITALVDTQILEAGLIGGHLLTRFAEKGFNYHLVKNPIKKTVIWQMKLPSKELQMDLQEECQSQDSQEPKTLKKAGPQLFLESVDLSYVLVVLEANEFLEMIAEGLLDKHIRSLQKIYPGFTLCYLINKLMWFLQKREQKQYKTPGDNWTRPPVEQVLAKLVTSYDGVHSRLCVDEAEVSEHIVGLTRSLAECPFKRKLTPLALSANGDHVVKNDPNNDIIKRDIWLKALVALPKVSGSCAIAIAKKYPSMRALFEAYLDPSKTGHEKEYLLQDLLKEGLLGGDHNRRIGPACSKRVFRILMAEQGNLYTDDVDEGADAFKD
ncbi:hypothetical protein L7F22_047821 [Adiantum nelumboides]|nr:hypothetical protein [Adiantum nelumboides]